MSELETREAKAKGEEAQRTQSPEPVSSTNKMEMPVLATEETPESAQRKDNIFVNKESPDTPMDIHGEDVIPH